MKLFYVLKHNINNDWHHFASICRKLIALKIIEYAKISSKRASENGDRLVACYRVLNKADSKKTKELTLLFLIKSLFSAELVSLSSVQGIKLTMKHCILS